jgi:Pyruvate/2-oxoglutarate dehydrogenase complex, dihydrolipoamide dehydrogenase (E3) component, and related enzymes
MGNTKADLIIIGGGPAGYVVAIRAAQLGLKTICVDERDSLGGTCLNIGCIPSTALLQSSERYDEARNHLAAHGISVRGVELELATMMARKDDVSWMRGRGRVDGARAGHRCDGRRRRGDRGRIHRSRHRIGGGVPSRYRHRQAKHRQFNECAAARERAEALGGDRDRIHRSRDGVVWRRLSASVTCVELED